VGVALFETMRSVTWFTCSAGILATFQGYAQALNLAWLGITSTSNEEDAERYTLPWKPWLEDKMASESVSPKQLFERLAAVNGCRQTTADSLLGPQKLKSVNGQTKKHLFDKIALALTNCHLSDHGRGPSHYVDSFSMTEAHFSIFTQMLLSVERLASELEHERWQRSVEDLVTVLYSETRAASNKLAALDQQAAMVLKTQRKIRFTTRQTGAHVANLTRQVKTGQEQLAHVIHEMDHAQDAAQHVVELLNNQELVISQVANEATLLSELASNWRGELKGFADEWKPTLDLVVSMAARDDDWLYPVRAVAFFLMWWWVVYQLPRSTLSTLMFFLAFGAEALLPKLVAHKVIHLLVICFALSHLYHLAWSSVGMLCPRICRDTSSGDNNDQILMSELIDLVAQLRMGQSGNEVSQTLLEQLGKAPPGYEIKDDEDGISTLAAIDKFDDQVT